MAADKPPFLQNNPATKPAGAPGGITETLKNRPQATKGGAPGVPPGVASRPQPAFKSMPGDGGPNMDNVPKGGKDLKADPGPMSGKDAPAGANGAPMPFKKMK
jgi:hypothetical protein